MEIVLAHGASGSAASMARHVDGLCRRGLAARAIDLPVRRADQEVAGFRAQLADPAATIIGGHSYGGRVASLLAAGEQVGGLLLLSYPLHRPGRPEEWRQRTEHWPRIAAPVLLISGEADPFAAIGRLRQAVGQLPRARLISYERLGHGLGDHLDDALDAIADWAQSLG
jgi:predicted alpha/beta-hydrolase family hydrolase